MRNLDASPNNHPPPPAAQLTPDRLLYIEEMTPTCTDRLGRLGSTARDMAVSAHQLLTKIDRAQQDQKLTLIDHEQEQLNRQARRQTLSSATQQTVADPEITRLRGDATMGRQSASGGGN